MPTKQKPREGSPREADQAPAPDFALSGRDVRRKRPPALSFLLRLDTLRSMVRVVTLFMFDAIGVYMAILTALWLKAGLLTGVWQVRAQAAATDELFDFACLLTVLLFARSGLYAARGERPGMSRIVSSLAQVALVAVFYAVASGHQFSSFYIFYGSLFFAVIYISLLRLAYEKTTGVLLRAAGYQRRAVLVGSVRCV